MSALFPGLGQVYNRRYWKLPIIVGGYLGLAYATNWNNSMLRDYTVAYADLLDNDPNTRSYMNMFSPNVKEENLDKGWLRNVLQSRKNYFRRNRDLCIICMVGVYLLAMVDAYVDASLSHFDISPDLSMDVAPAVMRDGRQRYPSVGLVWALNFRTQCTTNENAPTHSSFSRPLRRRSLRAGTALDTHAGRRCRRLYGGVSRKRGDRREPHDAELVSAELHCSRQGG